MDMPGVFELLVQLTLPGPPATQYLPEALTFAIASCAGCTHVRWLYTSFDVTCILINLCVCHTPGGQNRHFQPDENVQNTLKYNL